MELMRQELTKDLTPIMKGFAEAYVVHLNATRAAGEAGCTGKNLQQIGHQLLYIPKVAAYIEYLRTAQREKMGISLDRVTQEIARLAFVDPAKMYDENGCLKPVTEMDEDTRRAVASVQTKEIFEKEGRKSKYVGDNKKVILAAKDKALDMMMRHLGGYEKDNRQQQTNVIIVNGSEAKDIWEQLNSEF